MLDILDGVIEHEKDIEEGIKCLCSSYHNIITINMNGKNHGKGITDNRRHLTGSFLKRSSASVIFCQEVPDKFETEVVEKCYGEYEYAVTDKESAVMWRPKEFDGDPVQGTDLSITKIVEKLQKEESDVDVSEARTRTTMVKLRSRRTNASFLAVSWHGPWRPSEVTKLKIFHGLIRFLREVCEMEGLRSFIIGGDFNLNTSKVKQTEYGVTISSYELCTRDEKRESRGPGRNFVSCKDNFIASVTIPSDITVYWVEPLDLEDESRENPLLDHVPVVAILKLDRLVRTYKTKPFIKQDRGDTSDKTTNEKDRPGLTPETTVRIAEVDSLASDVKKKLEFKDVSNSSSDQSPRRIQDTRKDFKSPISLVKTSHKSVGSVHANDDRLAAEIGETESAIQRLDSPHGSVSQAQPTEPHSQTTKQGSDRESTSGKKKKERKEKIDKK